MNKPQDKTILVVDDEADVVFFLRTALEDVGFNVVSANDGEEALKLMRRQKPDFISIDLVMPRKSGIRLIHELRRNRDWTKIPFIIVTGHARDEQFSESLKDIMSEKTFAGKKLYLEKPVKAHDFVELVARELGVTLEETDNKGLPAVRDMKKEIDQMLNQADPETLKKIMDLLKHD